MRKFGLSKQERIKSDKDFKLIFLSGKVIYSEDRKLKTSYLIIRDAPEPGVKIATAVSKKAGNAVWRNRVKRLLRESYRLNKESLVSECLEKGLQLKLVFSPGYLNQKKYRKLKLDDVMGGVVYLINKIKIGL